MAATSLSRFALRTDERGGFRTAALPGDSTEFAMLQELWDTGTVGHATLGRNYAVRLPELAMMRELWDTGGPDRYAIRYIFMAYTYQYGLYRYGLYSIVMTCVVMAYIVKACIGGPGGGANRYTLRRAEVVETARQTSPFVNKVAGAWL